MIKKIMLLTTAAVLALGVTSLTYAQEKQNEVVNRPFKTEISKVVNQDKNDINNDMLDIMKKSGYEDLVKEVEQGNYKAMDDFMNNITEEDFQNMIDIMKKSGNENMAKMMESIGIEGMIEMHNSMGGAEACHGSNGNINKSNNTNSNITPNRMMDRSL